LTRGRKQNGDWSKPSTARIAARQLHELPDAGDREILSLLRGASDGRYGWYPSPAYDLLPQSFGLSPPLSALLVPRICRTGRCLLRPLGEDFSPTPLAWDDGPPWEFWIDLRPDSTAKRYRVTGSLRRGEERMDLSVEFPSWVPPGFRVRFHEWVVEAAHLPVGDYSIWRIIGHLFAHREYVVGSVIVVFAVILPVADLLLCALLTLPGAAAVSVLRRRRLLRVLGSTTKWSMGNVFLASLLIVFASAPGFYLTLEARPGLYCYAAGIILSLVLTEVVRRPNAATGC